MYLKVVIFMFSAIIFKVQSQCITTIRQAVPSCNTCSYGPQTLPCGTSSINCPVVTTVVDNSVSNGLANAIQLLILSNLVETLSGRPPVKVIEEDYCGPSNQVTEIIYEYEVPCNQGQYIESPCYNDEGLTYVDVAPPLCSYSHPACPVIAETILQPSIPSHICNFGCSVPLRNGENIAYIETCGCRRC